MMIENGFTLAITMVFDLIQSVYQATDTFAADFAQEYPSLAALRNRLDDIRARPGSLFLVAHDENELWGFLFIVPRLASKLRHTADLNMGVCAEARGQGVGTMLLRTAFSQLAEERIIELVYLMVRADNQYAIQLYETQGFSVLATLTRDTKIGTSYYNGLFMSKAITSATEQRI